MAKIRALYEHPQDKGEYIVEFQDGRLDRLLKVFLINALQKAYDDDTIKKLPPVDY